MKAHCGRFSIARARCVNSAESLSLLHRHACGARRNTPTTCTGMAAKNCLVETAWTFSSTMLLMPCLMLVLPCA